MAEPDGSDPPRGFEPEGSAPRGFEPRHAATPADAALWRDRLLAWGRPLLADLRISGIAIVLVVAYLIVAGTVAGADTLLEYDEDGYQVTVWAGDGCLRYGRNTSERGADERLAYCPATIPQGADGWAPQLKDFYTVDATGRTVTELVVFGVLPDQVVLIRSTLPGGHAVDMPAQRVDDIDHPVVLLHLRNPGLPVDLTETGGRRVFVRLELFDADGRAVPVV